MQPNVFSVAALAASLGAFAASSASAAEVLAVAAGGSGAAAVPLTSTSAMVVAAVAGVGAFVATNALSTEASKLPPPPADRNVPKSRFGLGEAKPPPPPREVGVRINAPVTVGTSFAKSTSPIISTSPLPIALAVQPHYAHGASRPLPAATSFFVPQPKPTPLGTSFDPPSEFVRPSWSSLKPRKAGTPREYREVEAMAMPTPLALSFAHMPEDEVAEEVQLADVAAGVEAGLDVGEEVAADAGVIAAV